MLPADATCQWFTPSGFRRCCGDGCDGWPSEDTYIGSHLRLSALVGTRGTALSRTRKSYRAHPARAPIPGKPTWNTFHNLIGKGQHPAPRDPPGTTQRIVPISTNSTSKGSPKSHPWKFPPALPSGRPGAFQSPAPRYSIGKGGRPVRAGRARHAVRYRFHVANLKDIAKETGLGLGTVSRALSGAPRVSPETRRRVEEAAERLGYRSNALARALRQSHSMTIGLVIPDMENEFYTSGAAILQEVLAAQGYQLVLCCSNNDPVTDAELLASLVEQRVAGIAHTPCSPAGARVARELSPGMPVVE